MKLNLGSDFDYKEGYVNLDRHEENGTHPDVIHDLNVFPYPFGDNTFNYIYASHILEHLDNVLEVMNELHRISKPGCVIEIKVPYWTSYNTWVDITHKRAFTYNSFSQLCGFFDSKGRGKNVGYQNILFKYELQRLIWGTTSKPILKYVANFMNWLVNFAPEFIERRFPFLITIEFLHVKLIVKKQEVKKMQTPNGSAV